MITAIIRGGLGNQLFQYAAAYSLARRLNQELMLDITFFPKQTLRGYKLDKLQLDSHLISVGENDDMFTKVYKNKYVNGVIRRSGLKTLPIARGRYLIDKAGSFTPEYFDIQAENILLNGYFQSEEYFINFRDAILRQFQPVYKRDAEYLETEMMINNTNSVAIHVRRGDFVNKDGSAFHYILGINYYLNAIAYLRDIIDRPVFFIFSDDINWVKNYFPKDISVHFVSLSSKNADIDEMMLMKTCKHMISANSTFSWWASWMNVNENAIHIAPQKQYGNEKMIPEKWILL